MKHGEELKKVYVRKSQRFFEKNFVNKDINKAFQDVYKRVMLKFLFAYLTVGITLDSFCIIKSEKTLYKSLSEDNKKKLGVYIGLLDKTLDEMSKISHLIYKKMVR